MVCRELEGVRMLITGGTGFLGRSLLDYLDTNIGSEDVDFGAWVLSRDPQKFLLMHPRYSRLSWLNFITGNLFHFSSNVQFTHIIHAAADTHSLAPEDLWIKQLVDGTRIVLDHALVVGVKRVLFVSSGAVYGKQYGRKLLREEDALEVSACETDGIYTHGKVLGEALCREYLTKFNLKSTIARCFSIISPHIPLDGPYAAGNFLSS